MIRRSHKLQPIDFPLLACALIIVCFGIVMVFSASYYVAQIREGNSLYYVTKQIYGAVLGFIAMMAVSMIDYNTLKKYSILFFFICIGFLIAVLIPGVGMVKNGARRWLGIGGIAFQPAEIAKFGLILFMARSMSDKQKDIKSFRKGLLPYCIAMAVLGGLILLQPNLSMIICLGIIWFAMMYAGGIPKRYLILMIVIAGVAVTFLAFGAGYRKSRMTTFLDPWADASGKGYQVIQSLYSVASGGLFGTGLGNSRQKMLFLPYGESDFIFAIMAEELGFIGILVYFGLCIFLFWRGIKIALTCDDMFGSLVATGVVASISSQIALNVAVAVKLIPTTGLTLPFISAGLTSLVVMMCNVGLLLNIS
ncbi:MAG: putative lipid II flippase FtsW, partial [Clostridia bacterium]|nr:putative lipid II flippase FtsW [Clostridia bacterium]